LTDVFGWPTVYFGTALHAVGRNHLETIGRPSQPKNQEEKVSKRVRSISDIEELKAEEIRLRKQLRNTFDYDDDLAAAIEKLDELGENEIAPEDFEDGFSGEQAIANLMSDFKEWRAAHAVLWKAMKKKAA